MSRLLLTESTPPASQPPSQGGGPAAPSLKEGGGGAATSDRSSRYLAGVDRFLMKQPTARARRSFLLQQIKGWDYRMQRFIMTDGESETITTNKDDPPHLSDFTLTLVGLQARFDAL